MICKGCNQETMLVSGCTIESLPGLNIFRVPHKYSEQKKCIFCDCALARLHHLDCPNEECPLCGDYIKSCGCKKEGE